MISRNFPFKFREITYWALAKTTVLLLFNKSIQNRSGQLGISGGMETQNSIFRKERGFERRNKAFSSFFFAINNMMMANYEEKPCSTCLGIRNPSTLSATSMYSQREIENKKISKIPSRFDCWQIFCAYLEDLYVDYFDSYMLFQVLVGNVQIHPNSHQQPKDFNSC